MKNLHLVPPIVIDLCESAVDARRNINERHNYIQRIEAIREYCDSVIGRFEKQTAPQRKIYVKQR